MTNNLEGYKSSEMYDALIIPTGETIFGDKKFPVSTKAVELFNTGKIGCIFVTGGYSGFAKYGPRKEISEADHTVAFLKSKGVPEKKIYSDNRSLETVGKFTFPIARPFYPNPSFDEFDNMLIIGQEGHLWRIMNVLATLPHKKNIRYYPVRGEHNEGVMTRVYHAGLMSAIHSLGWNPGAERIHKFLMEEHPFYSEGWYEKDPLVRKAEMAITGLEWLTRVR